MASCLKSTPQYHAIIDGPLRMRNESIAPRRWSSKQDIQITPPPPKKKL
jgi:hypothetical protein